ncbi:MAG: tRNA uridine-5-carboxymethylaminomethyl(34) synthesis GTPase MnmE [Gammaproteobacteria bacterium]
MLKLTDDTIVAQATAQGRAGVGIVRVSGPLVRSIIAKIAGLEPTPRTAIYADFHSFDNNLIDQGIILYFSAPNSFTGEEVVEFHCHGSPIVLDYLVETIIQYGARLARPGEFSERAFLNGKMDLAQAEAIADLIDSVSRQAAKASVQSLQGKFSNKIQLLVKELIHLRMYIEASIDFSEEEIDFLSDGKTQNQLKKLISTVEDIQSVAKQGELLKDGIAIAIIGVPNAGKSSLLNQLTGFERAIVTDIPGTTRDILREHIQIDGMPLHIIDTAGLRISDDVVEQEGIRRTTTEIERADHILLLIDGYEWQNEGVSLLEKIDSLKQYQLPVKKITIVINKIDLLNEEPSISSENGFQMIKLSAKTGSGIDLLKTCLKETVGYKIPEEGIFIARRRHLSAIKEALDYLHLAQEQLESHKALELTAEELLLAQNALSTITGEFTSDDLLGEIFSNFCVGK